MKFMLKNASSFIPSIRPLFLLFLVFALSACETTPSGSAAVSKAPSQAELTQDKKALIHTQLAQGYMQQKQYSTAKDSLEEALRISPKHSQSNYMMALLMMRLEQYPEAERFFDRAVRNDRENSAAAHDYGMLLCQIDKVRESIDYFEIAVSNPLFKRAELSYMRAGECLSKISVTEAEPYLKKALSLNPRLRPALFRLAQMKFDVKNYMSARAYVERFFAITEPQPEALLLAYQIESNLNAQDVAQTYRSTLLREFPGSRQAKILRESNTRN